MKKAKEKKKNDERRGIENQKEENEEGIAELQDWARSIFPLEAEEEGDEEDADGGDGDDVDEPADPVHPAGEAHHLHQLLHTRLLLVNYPLEKRGNDEGERKDEE